MTADSNHNGLKVVEVTEYITVAGSVAGTLAAMASQQFIYAAAPLTLALSLNLFTRRKFEQNLQQSMSTVLSEMSTRVRQVDRELSEEIRTLKGSERESSTPSPTVNLTPIQEDISQLQKRFDTLEQAITSFTSSEKELTPTEAVNFDPSYLESQIQQLQANISSVTTAFNERQELQRIEELRQIAEEIQQQLSVLNVSSAPADSSYLEKQIQQLQKNLASTSDALNQRVEQVRKITSEVQYHLSTLPPQPASFDASYLEKQLQELKATFTEAEETTRSNLNQLEQQNLQLQEALQSLNKGSSESSITEEIAELREINREVEKQVSDQPSAVDTSYLEAEIQQLKQEILSLRQLPPSQDFTRVADITLSQYLVAKMQRLAECFTHVRKDLFQVNDPAIASSQVKTPILTEVTLLSQPELTPQIESESVTDKLDSALTNLTESLVAKTWQMFDHASPQEEVSVDVEQVSTVPHPTVEVLSDDDMEVISQAEIELKNPSENKNFGIEKLVEMAENNGIGQAFHKVLETARKLELTLNTWPTNLMVSPAIHLLSSAQRNTSQCLFIFSTKPTKEGKILLWLSPSSFVEFYHLERENVIASLGADGWHEMDESEVEGFVASLHQLLGKVEQIA
ncbi:MAG TPA: hypothetical protein V6D28_29510 [Leptolyngbyaceae cyanobacterium]